MVDGSWLPGRAMNYDPLTMNYLSMR